ncbi:MAG: hypothetical protein JWL97_3497, partial [Gemmatimonadales bacterium]|nr:hypothetical protein [Gemmatimonadales bacterium]
MNWITQIENGAALLFGAVGMWTGISARITVRRDRQLVRLVGEVGEMRSVLESAQNAFAAVTPGQLKRQDWFADPLRAGLATQLRSRAERAQDEALRKHLTLTADRWDSLVN